MPIRRWRTHNIYYYHRIWGDWGDVPDQNPEEPDPVLDPKSESEKKIPTKRKKKPKPQTEKPIAPLFTSMLKFKVIF